MPVPAPNPLQSFAGWVGNGLNAAGNAVLEALPHSSSSAAEVDPSRLMAANLKKLHAAEQHSNNQTSVAVSASNAGIAAVRQDPNKYQYGYAQADKSQKATDLVANDAQTVNNNFQQINTRFGKLSKESQNKLGAHYLQSLRSGDKRHPGLSVDQASKNLQTSQNATTDVRAVSIDGNVKTLNDRSKGVTAQSDQTARTKTPTTDTLGTSQTQADANQKTFDTAKGLEQTLKGLSGGTSLTRNARGTTHDDTVGIATNTAHTWGNVDQVASGVSAHNLKTINSQLNQKQPDYAGAVNTATATGDIQRQAGIAADNARGAAGYLTDSADGYDKVLAAHQFVGKANQNFINTTNNAVPALLKGTAADVPLAQDANRQAQSATAPQTIVDDATHSRGFSESVNQLTGDLQRINADPRLQGRLKVDVPGAVTTAQGHAGNALNAANTAADTAFTPIVNGQVSGIRDAANTVNTDYRTWSADPTNDAKKQALLASIDKWQTATQGGYFAGGDTFSPDVKGQALNQLTDGYLSQLDPGLHSFLRDPLQHTASDVANMPTLTRQSNEAVYRYDNDPAVIQAQQQMQQRLDRGPVPNQELKPQQDILNQHFKPVVDALDQEAQGLLKQKNLDGNGGLSQQDRGQMQALMLQNHGLSNPTNDYQRAMASLVNGIWNPPSTARQQDNAPTGNSLQQAAQTIWGSNPFQNGADMIDQAHNQPKQFWSKYGGNNDAGNLRALADLFGQSLVGVSNTLQQPISRGLNWLQQQDDALANGQILNAASNPLLLPTLGRDWLLRDIHKAPDSQQHGINPDASQLVPYPDHIAFQGADKFLGFITGIPGFAGNIISVGSNDQKRKAFQDTETAFSNSYAKPMNDFIDHAQKLNAYPANTVQGRANLRGLANVLSTAGGAATAFFTSLGADKSTTPAEVSSQFVDSWNKDRSGTIGDILGTAAGFLHGSLRHGSSHAADLPQFEKADTPAPDAAATSLAPAANSNDAGLFRTFRPGNVASLELPAGSAPKDPFNDPLQDAGLLLTGPKGRSLPAGSVAGADGFQSGRETPALPEASAGRNSPERSPGNAQHFDDNYGFDYNELPADHPLQPGQIAQLASSRPQTANNESIPSKRSLVRPVAVDNTPDRTSPAPASARSKIGSALKNLADKAPDVRLGAGLKLKDNIAKGVTSLVAPKSAEKPGTPTLQSYSIGVSPKSDWGGIAGVLGNAIVHPLRRESWRALRDKADQEFVAEARPIEYTNETAAQTGLSPISNQTTFQFKGSDLQHYIHDSLFGNPGQSPLQALARNARVVGDPQQGGGKVVQVNAGLTVPHDPVTLGENQAALFGETPDMSRPEEDPTPFARLPNGLPYSKLMGETKVSSQPAILKPLLPKGLPNVSYENRGEAAVKDLIPQDAIVSQPFLDQNQAALGRVNLPFQFIVPDEATANDLARTPDAQLAGKIRQLVAEGKIDPSRVATWVPGNLGSGLRLSEVMGQSPEMTTTDLTGATRTHWNPAQTSVDVAFNEPYPGGVKSLDRVMDQATYGAKQWLGGLAQRAHAPGWLQRELAPRPKFLPMEHSIREALAGSGKDLATLQSGRHTVAFTLGAVPENLPDNPVSNWLRQWLPIAAQGEVRGQLKTTAPTEAPVLQNRSMVARHYGSGQVKVPYWLNSLIDRSQRYNTAVLVPQTAETDAYGNEVATAQQRMEQFLNDLAMRAGTNEKAAIEQFRRGLLPKFGDALLTRQVVNATDRLLRLMSRPGS